MRFRLFISATAKFKIASILIFLILGSLVSEAFAVSLGNNDLEQLTILEEDNKTEGESANNLNNRGCKKVESGVEDSELEINCNSLNKKYNASFCSSNYKVYSPLDLGVYLFLPSKLKNSRPDQNNLDVCTAYHILYHRLVFYEH